MEVRTVDEHPRKIGVAADVFGVTAAGLDEAGYVHGPSATWSTGPVNVAVEEGTT